MKFRTLTAAVFAGAIMTSAAPSVQAADYSMNDSGFWSWYFEIAAGGAIPYGHDVTVNGTPGEYEPDSGFGLAGAIGAYFQNNVRGEVAVSCAVATTDPPITTSKITRLTAERVEDIMAGFSFRNWSYTRPYPILHQVLYPNTRHLKKISAPSRPQP